MLNLFASTINQPAGQVDSIPSAVTGELLHYFTADPVRELLVRSRIVRQAPTFSPSIELGMSVALARAASKRGVSDEVDIHQAYRLCTALTRQREFRTLTELITLGAEISPKASALRQEIVFSGNSVASRAKLIYTPYAALPNLMKELAALTIHGDPSADPTVLVATTGFYCTHMHPFIDGNGRWARVVAASVGAVAGAPLLAALNVVMQNALKKELADRVWPLSRSSGLHDYLELSFRFEAEMITSLHAQGILSALEAIVNEIHAACRGAQNRATLLTRLLVDLDMAADDIRGLLGLSQRAMAGWLERIERASTSMIITSNRRICAAELARRIDDVITTVKTRVLPGDLCVESNHE